VLLFAEIFNSHTLTQILKFHITQYQIIDMSRQKTELEGTTK
jgi:hypothetical protein